MPHARRLSVIAAALVFATVSMGASQAVAQQSGAPPQSELRQAAEAYQNGDWQQAAALYETAYESAPEASRHKAEAALEWASLLWEQGDYQRAAKRANDALERARKLDMRDAIGRLLLTTGHIEASQGKLADAEQTLQICIKMSAEGGDEVFSALCTLNRRLVRELRGKAPGPKAEYTRAVATLEAAGTPLTVGASLAKTAELYDKLGDPARALGLLQQAHARFREAGSVPAMLRNRLRIARVLQDMGRFAEARTYLDGLVGRFEAMKMRPALVDALGLTARDREQSGQAAEAARLYERAYKVARQTGSPQLVGKTRLALCEFGGRAGDLAAAREHCDSAAGYFRKAGVPDLEARAVSNLAGIEQAAGNLDAASRHYAHVIERLANEVELSPGERQALVSHRANLCQVEMRLESSGAYHLCRQALEAVEGAAGAPAGMLAHTTYATGVAARQQAPKAAVDHLARAAELAAGLEPADLQLAADAMLRRGAMLAARTSRRDDAAADFRKGLAWAEKGGPELAASRVQLRTQLAQVELKREQWQPAAEALEALVADAAADAATKAWAYSGLANARLKLGDRRAAVAALEAGLPLAKAAGDKELAETFEANLAKLE